MKQNKNSKSSIRGHGLVLSGVSLLGPLLFLVTNDIDIVQETNLFMLAYDTTVITKKKNLEALESLWTPKYLMMRRI